MYTLGQERFVFMVKILCLIFDEGSEFHVQFHCACSYQKGFMAKNLMCCDFCAVAVIMLLPMLLSIVHYTTAYMCVKQIL